MKPMHKLPLTLPAALLTPSLSPSEGERVPGGPGDQVGRVTPCAPLGEQMRVYGAHGVARPACWPCDWPSFGM